MVGKYSFFSHVEKNVRHRRGASLTGYGLIVGLIAIAAILAVGNVGEQVRQLFAGVAFQLEEATQGTGGSGDDEDMSVLSPAAATVNQTQSPGECVQITLTNNSAEALGTLSVGTPDGDYESCGTDDCSGNGLSPEGSCGFGLRGTALVNQALAGEIVVSASGIPDHVIALSGTATGLPLMKITAGDDADEAAAFGYALAISGNTAIIGERFAQVGGTDGGAAWLVDLADGSLIERLQAQSPSSNDRFGHDIAIDGGRALVAAHTFNADNRGAAFLFDISSCALGSFDTAGCEQIAHLSASDAGNGDLFGDSAALQGNRALVGARRGDIGGTDVGNAYLFDISSCDSVAFGQAGCSEIVALRAVSPTPNDFYGLHVDLDSNLAIIGAPTNKNSVSRPGAAHLVDISSCSGSFGAEGCQEIIELTPSVSFNADRFGIAVAIEGTTVVVGADATDIGAGAAYLFDVSGCTVGSTLGDSGCEETAQLLPPSPETGDNFGRQIALFGSRVLVGAETKNDTGMAYLFPTSGGVPSHVFQAPDGAAGDQFGAAVDLTGTHTLIGAFGNINNTGAIYLFSTP